MKRCLIPGAICLLFLLITAIILFVYCRLMSQAAVPTIAPAEREDYTLVLDAGHGGLDGGAVAPDGTRESQLNLEIVLRMEKLCRLMGIPAVLTRASDSLDYPDNNLTIRQKKVWDQKNRVEQVAETENALLISIHQNTFPDSRPWGTEVLYARTEGSKELGEAVHAALVRCLNPENRRVAMPISDSIYLMRSVRCPAILVECGFLSNASDVDRLKSPAYQKQLSVIVLGTYLQYLSSPG